MRSWPITAPDKVIRKLDQYIVVYNFFYRGITDIIIIHKEILKLKVEGQMTQAPNRIDSNAQMIEISFQDFRHGSRQFCVKASDR
jgi:hypothetical protein